MIMRHGKEFRNKVFSLSPIFSYLPDSDRYLFAMDPPTHRFNLIGSGLNGMEHIRVTQMEGRATIHGVFDTSARSAAVAQKAFAQAAPGASLVAYDSLEAACNDPAVDGLIICTPNYSHIDVARVAAKSGKHILLEKPMATTVPDAYEIAQIANAHPAVFQIGLQYRYKPIYVEAIHAALERKTIGNIKTITILEHRFPFLDKVKQWNKFSKYSGGTLVEKCCHYFDLMNLFAGARPVSVFATGSMAVNFLEFEYAGEKSDILDNAFVIVTYENGVRANFNLCMFSPMFYEELVLCGDEGRLKAFEKRGFFAGRSPRDALGDPVRRPSAHPDRTALLSPVHTAKRSLWRDLFRAREFHQQYRGQRDPYRERDRGLLVGGHRRGGRSVGQGRSAGAYQRSAARERYCNLIV